MTEQRLLDIDTYERIDDFLRVATFAVAKAQEDSRQKGVPNVYSINGRIYFELPSGELSTIDPFLNKVNHK